MRVFKLFLIPFAAASILASQALAVAIEAPHPRERKEYARLRKQYSRLREDARLPVSVQVEWRRKDFDRAFALVSDYWSSGLEVDWLRGIVEQVAAGKKELTPEEAKRFKRARDGFKTLRFAFVAFGKSHGLPEKIDELTARLGKMRDALARGESAEASEHAREIAKRIDAESFSKLEAEVAEFRAAKRGNFRDWLREEMEALRSGLREESLSGEKFHKLRKSVGAVRVLLQALLASTPDRSQERLLAHVGNLNERMGMHHDELVRLGKKGTIDYEKEAVKVPTDIWQDGLRLASILLEAL